jgi:hypothetical protein
MGLIKRSHHRRTIMIRAAVAGKTGARRTELLKTNQVNVLSLPMKALQGGGRML